MRHTVSLEPAAEALCMAAAPSPSDSHRSTHGRLLLERTQDAPVYKYPATFTVTEVDTGSWGVLRVYFIRPETFCPDSGVLYYLHGGGWVAGSLHTHDKLLRELAARTGRLVVFPEYTRTPEARYPVALEQCYVVLRMLPLLLEQFGGGVNIRRLAIAGDSAGGNLAAALTILAKYRFGPLLQGQLLFYPVVNACFDTASYRHFATGHGLTRQEMRWYWQQYAPCLADRRHCTASPLLTTTDQLRCLPPALIVTAEADVLRDEGAAYACKLRRAGVETEYLCCAGIIHDFLMRNDLDATVACRIAMDAAVGFLSRI